MQRESKDALAASNLRLISQKIRELTLERVLSSRKTHGMSLTDTVNDSAKTDEMVDDCMRVLELEVADKSGLAGIAVKAGYAAVKRIKPGFVRNVIRDLLPEFAAAIEPVHEEASSKGESPKAYFTDNKSRVADALLSITDEKAAKSTNKVITKTYKKLRGGAKAHVEAAAPRLGELVEKFA